MLKLNTEVENVKRDRIKDQKIITDYEGQLNALNNKLNDKINGLNYNEAYIKEENSMKLEVNI
jgi:hypothetical protein